MIKALLLRDVDKHVYDLDIKGHASYAEKGKDIVCASVSSLAFAAYYTLITFEEARHCRIVGCKVDDDGMMHLRVASVEGMSDACIMTIFSTIAHGLEAIAKKYPKYMQFELVTREIPKEDTLCASEGEKPTNAPC